MSKMNPEVKAKWVAALRSGEYKQGRNKLRVGDAFCCLGVLCDLQDANGWKPVDCGIFTFGAHEGMPPEPVRAWAGFEKTSFGFLRVPRVRIAGVCMEVDEHNDNGRTFAEIADAIEAQL